MTKEMLLHLSARAAIVGGGLRILDAFLNHADIRVQQTAYFVTDALLIFALCGIYLSRSNGLGLAGFLGFVASIIGLLIVRSFGQGAYIVGASVTLLGVVLLSVAILVRAAFPKSAPILWISSLIVGLISLPPFRIDWGFTVAGVIFGSGFIAAGLNLRPAALPGNYK